MSNGAQLHTHQVTVDGIVQRYHVAGRGPLCVAHPGGPGLDWSYLRMPPLENFLTMVYVEPVGTGGSGRLPDPRDYTRATHARFLDAVITDLGGGPILLLGHSYGGFVAQEYAIGRPDRVSGLILYDTSPITGDEFWQAALAGMAAFPERHPSLPQARQVARAFLQPTPEYDDESFTRRLRATFPAYLAAYWADEDRYAPMRQAVRGYFDAAQGENPDPLDTRAGLSTLDVPILVLVGRHDFICGVRFAEMIRAAAPHAELVVFENSGHFAHLEEPAAFAGVVEEFVRTEVQLSRRRPA
ncbi:alpha/beta hydrolase [Actinoplanes sp. NPDC024001]|uniref:alpha/beta fold hydrolase n=1 Tax=Actinoplanes sp. NPDC024001 TaxID=3154598 RepID=UPI0033CD8BFD